MSCQQKRTITNNMGGFSPPDDYYMRPLAPPMGYAIGPQPPANATAWPCYRPDVSGQSTCAHCGAVSTASFVADASKLMVGGIGGLAAIHGVGAAGDYMDKKNPSWGGATLRDAMWQRQP